MTVLGPPGQDRAGETLIVSADKGQAGDAEGLKECQHAEPLNGLGGPLGVAGRAMAGHCFASSDDAPSRPG